jgi:hypothetical protein
MSKALAVVDTKKPQEEEEVATDSGGDESASCSGEGKRRLRSGF